MSLKEKQAAAKQTFVFLGSLANEYPAKQDVERDSADSCAHDIMSAREPTCLHDWRTAKLIMIVAKQR